jgi:hypothetical protein
MVDFESGCPVGGCKNNRSLLTWHHHDCGATETIDCEGVVRCRKNHTLGEFFLLKYSCGGHNNGLQYGDYSAFLAALSICSNFGADFAFKLTQKLMDAYKNGRMPHN